MGYPGDGEEDGVASGEVSVADQSSFSMEAPSGVELLDQEIQEGEFDVSLVGQVENTGDDLEYLEAVAKFYNGDGNVVATGLDNVRNVGSGETWQFEISYASTDPTAPDVPPDYAVTLSE